ncbi:MAG: hypothetical protein ACM4AI_16130 [Acidobacteriota bacterium]
MITGSGFRSWDDLREHLRELADDVVRDTVSRALLAGADDIDLLDEMIACTRASNYRRIDEAIENLRESGLLRERS